MGSMSCVRYLLSFSARLRVVGQPALMCSRRTEMSYSRPKKKSKTVEKKQEGLILAKEAQFLGLDNKNPSTFLDIIRSFEVSNPNRRGHVEFIYAALKVMKEFGVEGDGEYYKKLLEVFPQEKMIPKNSIQVAFFHFPLQQNCAVHVLEQMEENGVLPDEEFVMILMKSFGYRSQPMKKLTRMIYWTSKFRFASPWILPKPMPNDTLQVARLAIERITSVDLQTVVSVLNTEDVADSVDKTWIVSGQSAQQQKLLERISDDKPLFIDGAFRIWLRQSCIAYFTLRADPPDHPPRRPGPQELDDVSDMSHPYGLEETQVAHPFSIHEQEDATIYAVCATGSSSRDSLLSWLRFLHNSNPKLKNLPVIFKLKAPSTAVVPLNFTDDRVREDEEKTEVK